MACHRCHPAPFYSDLKAHKLGDRGPNDLRRSIDTPTLVEVWRTRPYMRDGRYTTIKELLIEGRHGLRGRRGDDLSDQDMSDLAEFVLSL